MASEFELTTTTFDYSGSHREDQVVGFNWYHQDSFDHGEFGLMAFQSLQLSTQNVLYPRSLYVYKEYDSMKVSAGYKIFNFSNQEFFKGQDFFNAKYLRSSKLDYQRMGLPVVDMTYYFDEDFFQAGLILESYGNLYPASKNRLGIGVPFTKNYYATGSQTNEDFETLTQFFLRYKGYASEFEWSYIFARKYDVENPLFVLRPPENYINAYNVEITPLYIPANIHGLALQHGWEEWLLKYDFVYKDYFYENQAFFVPPLEIQDSKRYDHSVFTIGAEHTSNGERFEFRKVLEYTTVLGLDGDQAKSNQLFQRDLALILQWRGVGLNPHTFEFSYAYDVQTYDEHFFNARYLVRLDEDLKFELLYRGLYTVPPGDDLQTQFYGLRPLRDSDFLQLSLRTFY